VLPESCLRIWTVSFDPGFWIFTGKAISLSLSSSGSNRWKPSLLLLLLFQFECCDHTCSAPLPVACSCSYCRCSGSMMKIHSESLRTVWNSIEFACNVASVCLCGLNLVMISKDLCELGAELPWIALRVSWRFLSFLWLCGFWSVTERRESVNSVCDVAPSFFVIWLLILLCVAFYRLPSGILTNWGLPCGLWTASVALDLKWANLQYYVKFGLNCNFIWNLD